MFSKIIITAILGSSVIGGSAATGFIPTGLEITAGPVRIVSGNGKMVSAHLGNPSKGALTISTQDGRRLKIQF